MRVGDIKIFGKNEKESEALIETIRIFREDKRMEFGFEKCYMLIIKNKGKGKSLKKSLRIIGEKKKRKLQISGIIRSRYHQTNG